jgi:hypothetical protein
VLASKVSVSSLSSSPEASGYSEAGVTLFCLRPEDGTANAPPAVDWRKALEFAQSHGVLQFLAAALERGRIEVPEPWRSLLVRQQQRNAARAMIQHRECGAVLSVLAAAGIPAAAFKGTTLSKLLYGRVADRISSDIDVLVPLTRFSEARSVIEGIGYEVADGSARLDEKTLLVSGNELTLLKSNGTVVELHWRLFETDRACGLGIHFEDLEVEEGQLSNEELFLVLVVHGLTHRWETLKWIVDIDGFVRNVSVDWDRLLRRAARTGTLRATRIALLLTQELLGTPLPRPISDRRARRLAATYGRALITSRPIPPIRDFWMQLAARERWIDRLRFLRFVATPRPWDHSVAGPRRLSRLVRLVSEGLRAPRLADVQKIPELQPPADPDDK